MPSPSRRSSRSSLVAALAVALVAACGGGDTTPSNRSNTPLELTLQILDSPVEAAFDGFENLTFPVTTDLRSIALDAPPAGDLVVGLAARDLESATGAPAAAWRTAAATSSAALVVATTADPDTYAIAEFGRTSGGWELRGIGEGQAQPVVPVEGERVDWTITELDGTEAAVRLHPRGCRSGAPLAEEDVRAIAWPIDTGLAMVIVEAAPGDDQECQSRPSSDGRLTLPPGTTDVVDGWILPPGAAGGAGSSEGG